MERDKSRMLKHIHDKKKYKPKSKQAALTVAQKQKPKQLESNWDRYEEEEPNSFQLGSSTDFAILANNPVIKGSHFQFKSDKYDLDTAQELHGDIFSLDLNLLNLSMSTIPYYEFFPDKELFSENQRKYMDKKAADNLELYNGYIEKVTSSFEDCKDNEDNVKEKMQSLDIQDTPEVLPQVSKEEGKSEKEIKPIEKDSTTPDKDSDDLETWLEDILDD